MLRLLCRQTVNALKEPGFWYLTQNALLWGFILLFGSHYFKPFLQSWQHDNPPVPLLLLNGLLLYLLAAFPVFLSGSIARQLPLSLLRPLPLASSDLLKLLFYYLHKNWLWGWVIFTLFWLTEWRIDGKRAMFLIGLFAVLVLGFTIFSLGGFLKLRRRKKVFFFLQGVMAATLIVGSILWRHSVNALLLFDFLLGGLALTVGWLLSRKTEAALDKLYPLAKEHAQKKKGRARLQKNGGLWRQLVRREFLNLWRNPTFRRGKLWMLLATPLVGFLLFHLYPQQALNFFTLTVFLLVWRHYGQFFSTHFAQREPEWFFKGLNLPFFSYASARFAVEFLFVLFLLVFFSFTLHFNHIPLSEHWQLLLFLLFAAAMILVSLISFQIIFFDNPQTAGYAFHFSLLFFTILTLWDRFLGPLITVFFLTLYVFKSYRFLRS